MQNIKLLHSVSSGSRSFIRVILNDTHREVILEDGGLHFKRNKKGSSWEKNQLINYM